MRSASISTSWSGGPASVKTPVPCGQAGAPSANVTRAAVAALGRRHLALRPDGGSRCAAIGVGFLGRGSGPLLLLGLFGGESPRGNGFFCGQLLRPGGFLGCSDGAGLFVGGRHLLGGEPARE